nr:MAG TPA: hypothetical protein [Caudoviricetes sp.]
MLYILRRACLCGGGDIARKRLEAVNNQERIYGM